MVLLRRLGRQGDWPGRPRDLCCVRAVLRTPRCGVRQVRHALERAAIVVLRCQRNASFDRWRGRRTIGIRMPHDVTRSGGNRDGDARLVADLASTVSVRRSTSHTIMHDDASVAPSASILLPTNQRTNPSNKSLK